jgi:hypothetical protein
VVLEVVGYVAPDLAHYEVLARPPDAHQGRAPPLLLSA